MPITTKFASGNCRAQGRRECRVREIENLHFDDLRHEATSRLFETGRPVEKVALMTGHKDWKMLNRYTHLRPEDLHTVQTQPQPTFYEHIQKLAEM